MTLDEQCFWQAAQSLTGIFSPYLRNREEGFRDASWAVGALWLWGRHVNKLSESGMSPTTGC